MKCLTASDLHRFRADYQQSRGKRIEKQVGKYGIARFTLDERIVKENPARFNVELPSYHFYDQHDSGRCWCFSGLNLIERNVAENMDITPRQLSLSGNFLAFYNKLEKASYLYNFVVENDCNIEKLRQKATELTSEGAYFANFVNLIYKYGLVPSSAMPENKNTNYSRDYFIYLWREKTRANALELWQAKLEVPALKLEHLRKQKLSEMYAFLSKICGEPPALFSYKYTDRGGKRRILRNYSPTQFRDEFLTLDLRKFKLVCCDPLKKFHTTQKLKGVYSDDPFNPEVEYLNLPKFEIKRLVVAQLESGLPVKFSTRTNLFKNKDERVLDVRLHDYSRLGVKLADYETGVAMGLITSQHSMVITGAQVEDGRPIRWKVENTHSPNRLYVMNDNFFDAYVMSANVKQDIIKACGISF